MERSFFAGGRGMRFATLGFMFSGKKGERSIGRTRSTDIRVYWLVEGSRAGKRLQQYRVQEGQPAPASFLFPVEMKEKLFYFAALKNGEVENFFGSVVAAQPVDKILAAFHLDPAPPGEAVLEVALQGVTKGSHRVKVQLNHVEVGEIVFVGRSRGLATWAIPHSVLLEGENPVTLTSQNGNLFYDGFRVEFF